MTVSKPVTPKNNINAALKKAKLRRICNMNKKSRLLYETHAIISKVSVTTTIMLDPTTYAIQNGFVSPRIESRDPLLKKIEILEGLRKHATKLLFFQTKMSQV